MNLRSLGVSQRFNLLLADPAKSGWEDNVSTLLAISIQFHQAMCYSQAYLVVKEDFLDLYGRTSPPHLESISLCFSIVRKELGCQSDKGMTLLYRTEQKLW